MNEKLNKEEELKAIHREEIKTRNEATKVWIQSDTQCRAYCHEIESQLLALREENEGLSDNLDRLLRECISAYQWRRPLDKKVIDEITNIVAKIEKELGKYLGYTAIWKLSKYEPKGEGE